MFIHQEKAKAKINLNPFFFIPLLKNMLQRRLVPEMHSERTRVNRSQAMAREI